MLRGWRSFKVGNVSFLRSGALCDEPFLFFVFRLVDFPAREALIQDIECGAKTASFALGLGLGGGSALFAVLLATFAPATLPFCRALIHIFLQISNS
jgi:hypothetical protein